MSVKVTIDIVLNFQKDPSDLGLKVEGAKPAFKNLGDLNVEEAIHLRNSVLTYSEVVDDEERGGILLNGFDVTEALHEKAVDVLIAMDSHALTGKEFIYGKSYLPSANSVAPRDVHVRQNVLWTNVLLGHIITRNMSGDGIDELWSTLTLRDMLVQLFKREYFIEEDGVRIVRAGRNASRFVLPTHPLAGTVVVIGYARSGKTTLVHAFDRYVRHRLGLKNKRVVNFYSCGEPTFGSIPLDSLVTNVSVNNGEMIASRINLLSRIARAETTQVDHFNIIDSIREASIHSGNTLSGGISAYVPELLTKFSQDDSGYNRFSLVSFNPISFSDRQKETLEAVVQGLLGAASGVITKIDTSPLGGRSVEEVPVEVLGQISFLFSHRGFRNRESTILTLKELIEACMADGGVRSLHNYGTSGSSASREVSSNSTADKAVVSTISTIILGEQ